MMNFLKKFAFDRFEFGWIEKAAALDCNNMTRDELPGQIHNYGDSTAVDLMNVYDFKKISTDDLKYICWCFMTGRDVNINLEYASR